VVKHLVIAAALAACGDNLADTNEARQGGETTVDDRTRDAFSHPAANLTDDQQSQFQLGSSAFDFHWPIPLLGPLFNSDGCGDCHGGNGRGLSQIGNGALESQALIRVSLVDGTPGGTPDVPGGDVPVPDLGLQLQDHATVGLPEVVVTQSWIEHAEQYGDGEVVMLREPRIDVQRPDGSPLGGDVRLSYRQAPGAFGLGLLEAVPEEEVMALADPDDADGDGISGRFNLVWDPDRQATVAGRFGHKATAGRPRRRSPMTSACRTSSCPSPTGAATWRTTSSSRPCSSCRRSACRPRHREMRRPARAGACSTISAVPGVTCRRS